MKDVGGRKKEEGTRKSPRKGKQEEGAMAVLSYHMDRLNFT